MRTLSTAPADEKSGAEPTRRDFLYIATAATAAVGMVTTMWPLIDQMNPDGATVVAGGAVDTDLKQIDPGQQVVVLWSARPVFVVNRTKAALNTLQIKNIIAQLSDPNSVQLQQPSSRTIGIARSSQNISFSSAYARILGASQNIRRNLMRLTRRRIGRVDSFVIVTVQNMTSPAGSKVCPRPTISRCLPIIFPTTIRFAWARSTGR